MIAWAGHQDILLHECTVLFMRSMFPQYLPHYHWAWPTMGEEPLDLSPAQFGWPASRSRCYTATLL